MQSLSSQQRRPQFEQLGKILKLTIKLMGDRRVPVLLKILPIASAIYFLAPDLLPGPIDDAVAVWLGTYLFVTLAPDEVVAEYLDEGNTGGR